MDFYKETFETWNSIAKLYEDKFMKLNLYNHSYDYCCQAIGKNNAKILEVGCGPGNITNYLLSKRPDFNILGIDIAPNMVELAKANNPAAKFEVMDVRDLHQIESKFDAIIGGFCLPYLTQKDAEKFMLDCSNLLLENGLLYLSFVEGETSKSGFQAGSNGMRSYFNFHQENHLKTLLTKNKFSHTITFKVDYEKGNSEIEEHTILIAKKVT